MPDPSSEVFNAIESPLRASPPPPPSAAPPPPPPPPDLSRADNTIRVLSETIASARVWGRRHKNIAPVSSRGWKNRQMPKTINALHPLDTYNL